MDKPALRPSAFCTSMAYVANAEGSSLSICFGNLSAYDAELCDPFFTTELPAASVPAAVPHCNRWGSMPRQIFVTPTLRNFWRSVVTVGTVHVSVTSSPVRTARRSDGGFGKFSDGGCGGEIVAHAVSSNKAGNGPSALKGSLMRNSNRLSNQAIRPTGRKQK